MEIETVISKDGVYRYSLTRSLSWPERPGEGACLFIMLNPSTANAETDDPTIRRCIRFASDWGYKDLWVANLFAYRATNPEVLKGGIDAVGRENDYWIKRMACQADLIICAWGNGGGLRDRDYAVFKLVGQSNMRHLGLTRQNKPKHPLYLRADTQPMEWKR